jgi:hypothetical protein
MKKWIDDHMSWIVGGIILLIGIILIYFVSSNMCWDCPAVNITSGDLIT